MKSLILHLGGNIHRAEECINLANQFKDSPILVSSELGNVLEYYTSRGILAERVFIDNNAWDTVTNFTTTFKRIKEEFKASKVHVVTDAFHMRRVRHVARAIYWRRKVSLVFWPTEGINIKESTSLLLSNIFRAWVWRLTGILIYSRRLKREREGLYK